MGCVVPFMAFAPDVRRVVHTTDPIEALNGTEGGEIESLRAR